MGVSDPRWSRAMVVTVALVPLLLVAWFTFAEPRPYHLFETDIEADYFYNGKLVRDGRGIVGTYHPGTPLYLAMGGLVALVGDAPDRAGAVLLAGRWLAALATALALVFVLRGVRREAGGGVAVLVGASALAWPSTLYHVDYVSPDAWTVALGLPLVWLAWREVARFRPRRIVGLGALAGLALAVKLSFLPLAVAVGAGVAVQVGRVPEAGRVRLGALAGGAAALVGVFCLATLPVLDHMPGVLISTFVRPSARPARDVGGGGPETGLIGLALANPALAVLVIAAVVAVGVGWRRQRGGTVDRLAAGVMVGLGLVMLAYLAGVAARGLDARALRHAAPVSMAVPLLVLVAWDALGRPVLSSRQTALAGLAALVVLAAPLASVLAERRAFLREAADEARITWAALDGLTEGRLAFWDGAPAARLGPAGFHFWGDYRYANEQYAEHLLRAFPDRAFLRLRDLRRGLEDPVEPRAEAGALAGVVRYWYDRRGQWHPRPTDVLAFGSNLGAVVMPEEEHEAELGPYALDSLAAGVLGPVRTDTLTAAGTRWLVVRPLSP